MEQLDRILVIHDDQHHTQSALHRAIELAKVCSASIHVVATTYQSMNYINGDILLETEALLRHSLIEQEKKKLNQFIDSVKTLNIDISYEVLWTPVPQEDISRVCREKAIDLLIKTANKHHHFEGIFHTPLDWHLLRECPCSVLLVTEDAWPKGSTVLASIDTLSDDEAHQKLNQKILQQASFMADILDDTIHAATACPPLPVLVDLEYTTVDPNLYIEEVRESALQRSKEITKETFLPGDNIHVVMGLPEQAIPDLAKQLNSRMIVLGTVARSGLKGYLIGNTAEHMLYELNCDILAVKPDQ